MKPRMHKSASNLSRRDMIKVTAAGLALLTASIVPAVAIAEEESSQAEPIFHVDENTSIGDYVRTLHPDIWEQIHPDIKAVLNTEQMRLEAPSGISTRVSGSAYISATDGFSYSTYDGSYMANELCPMVACSVTYSRGGYIYYESPTKTREQSRWCSISGAAHASAGTYNVVITGYPIQPPPGGSVEFSQAFDTATIY